MADNDEQPIWPVHWLPEQWEAAAIAISNGTYKIHSECLLGLAPDALFKTAEDVKKILGLDHIPETFKAHDVDIPFGKIENARLIEYCSLPVQYYCTLTKVAVFKETICISLNGKERNVHTPGALNNKNKNIKWPLVCMD